MTELTAIRDHFTEILENVNLGELKNIPFNADPDGTDIGQRRA
jgi:hypothetical protein